MSIEEIEQLWASQPLPAGQGDPAALRGQIHREIRHHLWFRYFLVAAISFCIVISPVLFYLNGQYAAHYNSPLNVVSLALRQIVGIATLYFLIRSLRRNRAMLRRRGDTLQAVIATALANIESEMADYNVGFWGVLFGLVTGGLAAYANFQYPQADWRPLMGRLAFIIVLVGGAARAFRQHYRKNLVPEHDRLQQTLAELRD